MSVGRHRTVLVVAVLRAALAAAILAAILATHWEVASRGPVNLLNLYGYFTVQSNLIGAVALAGTAVAGFGLAAPRAQPFPASTSARS